MPSRAKLRKIELAKKDTRTPAEKVGAVTYADLYNTILTVGGLVKRQHDEIELLRENLSEVSLRVRYIMQHFKFEKGSPIVGLDGRLIPGEVATLFDRYQAEREPFLDALTRQVQAHDDQAADPHHGAEGGEPAGATPARLEGVNGTVVAPGAGPRLVVTKVPDTAAVV